MEQKLKKLVIVLAVLGVFGFIANLLVDNPYTHRLFRKGINDVVRGSTHLLIDFKAIKVSVVPPGVDLYGVHVATDVEPNNPLVTASHASTRISLMSLILGEIKLGDIEMNDLTVVWPPPWNFAGFLKDEQPGPPKPEQPMTWPPAFDLPLRGVVLRNAKIYFEAPLNDGVPYKDEQFVMSLVGVDLDFDFDDWRDAELEMQVQSLNAAMGAASMLEDTAVDLGLELVGSNISITRLKLNGGRLKTDGNAFVSIDTAGQDQHLTGLELSVHTAIDGDLSVLGSYLDLADTRGNVIGKADVKAVIPFDERPGTFSVTGEGTIRDGYLDGFRLFNSNAAFVISETGIRFPNIDLIVDTAVVGQANGDISFTDTIDYRFNVRPTGLRLMDLLDALGVDFEYVDTAIHSPDLVISGKGDPFVLNVAATAGFSDINLPATPYDQSKFPRSPACRLAFQMAVTSSQLDFGGTRGHCFEPQSGSDPMPSAGRVDAPSGARAVSPIALRGQVFFDAKKGLQLEVKSDALDAALGEYFAQVQLAGKGPVTASIHGPFDRVLIDNQFNLSQAAVLGIPIGRVAGIVTMDGDKILWKGVDVTFPQGGTISAPRGSLTLDDGLTIKTAVTAGGVSPQAFGAALKSVAPDVPLALGIDSLDAEVEGPLLFPLAWRGRIAARASQITYDGQVLIDSANAVLAGTAQGWQGEDIVASLGDLSIGAKFKHKRAKPFSLTEAQAAGEDDPWTRAGLTPHDEIEVEFATIAASNIPEEKQRLATADHLATLPFVGKTLAEIGLGGQISANGRLTGKTNDVQGTFNASIVKPTVFGATLAPINVKGFVKGSHLDLVVDHSGSAFEGRLSLDLMKKNLPYEWFFAFNRMDLRALGTQYFYGDPRNYAYLTANWQMKGEFGDWWRSVGTLDIKDIRAKYVQDIGAQTKTMQIRQEQPVKVLFTKDGWRFDEDKDLYLSGRNLQLRISATGSKPPERLGIKLESIIDMAIMREFTQQVDTARGKLRVVAELPGSVDKPDLTVEVTDLKNSPFIAATWTPVTLGLADLRPAFTNVRMRVIYKDGRLVIDSLNADKGSGSLSASGALNLAEDAEEESRLDVNLKDTTVIYPVAFLKSFETQLSGNVSVSGKGKPYRISGDVVIDRARSTQEVNIGEEIINALRRQSFTASVIAEKPTVVFDLNISADESINIHNRNLQSVLSADLQIKGNDITPSVLGQVEVDKGKFIYKRDFQITRGLVTFDDPVKPDPSLDILAVSDVDAYRVYIAITGRASNPTVEFSVDPPTRETGAPISKLEILVLLSRGKLPEESRTIGQTTREAAASEAINLLIMGQFEEPVEKLFDMSGQNVVRNVYIDTYPDENGTPAPRLNLPLDLGEDFDVVFRAAQSTSEVSGEYDVHENITLSTTLEKKSEKGEGATEQSQTGAVDDTKFNLKFRFSFE